MLYCRYCCIVKLYVYKFSINLVALYCSIVYCKSASTVVFKVVYVNKFIQLKKKKVSPLKYSSSNHRMTFAGYLGFFRVLDMGLCETLLLAPLRTSAFFPENPSESF